MIALLTWIGPALVAGLVLGAVIGRLAGLPRTRPALVGTLVPILAGIVAGGLAGSGLVPGRPGLWVETAALLLGAYLAGAALGAVTVRHRTVG